MNAPESITIQLRCLRIHYEFVTNELQYFHASAKRMFSGVYLSAGLSVLPSINASVHVSIRVFSICVQKTTVVSVRVLAEVLSHIH